jgi:hypothetical protein
LIVEVTAALSICVLAATAALFTHSQRAAAPQGTPPSVTPSPTLPTPPPSGLASSAENTCGAWSAETAATGAAITARYGTIRTCIRIDGRWLIFTDGVYRGDTVATSGAVLVDNCTAPSAPPSCSNGNNDHPFTDWKAVLPPQPGPVRLLEAWNPPNLLVADAAGDQYFNIDTDAFSSAQDSTT